MGADSIVLAVDESKTLKVLPSSHSSDTWCIVVNASMLCLPTTFHKAWCAGYNYRNDKEVIHFNCEKT